MSQLMDLNRCHRLMEEQNLDALLVSSPLNFGYVTGFFWGNTIRSQRYVTFEYDHVPVLGQMGRSLWGGYAVVARDEESFAVSNRFVADTLDQLDCWIRDLRPYGSGWFKGTMPADWMNDDPVDMLSQALVEKGLDRKRVGIDWSSFPAGAFQKLSVKLPAIQFVDAESLLWRLRMVKTPEEIRRMRKAADVTVKAMEAAFAAAREGMTEIEFVDVMRSKSIEEGADLLWTEINFGFQPKQGTGDVRGWTPTERRLKKGDLCAVDSGGFYQMYVADMGRWFWFGREPTEEERKGYEAVLQALDEALKVVRPGTPCAQVYRIVEDILEPMGYTPAGQGHGVGLMPHEPPCFSDVSDETLEENMVMTLEIGVGIPIESPPSRRSLQIEDEILVTRDGAENLSLLPRWVIL